MHIFRKWREESQVTAVKSQISALILYSIPTSVIHIVMLGPYPYASTTKSSYAVTNLCPPRPLASSNRLSMSSARAKGLTLWSNTLLT